MITNDTRIQPEEERRELLNLIGDAWDDGNATGLDGYAGPGRGEAGGPDQEAEDIRERFLRKAEENLDALPLRNAQVEAVLNKHIAQDLHGTWYCTTCVDELLDYQPYPCETVRAIEEAGR